MTEPLLCDLSVPGRVGFRYPQPGRAPRAACLLGCVRQDLPMPELVRGGCGAPLHAAIAAQPQHRHRLLPAGLVHDEVQPQGERGSGAPAGLCLRPSPAAGGDRAGWPAADVRAAGMAEGDRRLRRCHPAAGRGRPWRADRCADHPRLPRSARGDTGARQDPDPRLGAWHQPRHLGHERDARGRAQIRRAWQRGPGGAAGSSATRRWLG